MNLSRLIRRFAFGYLAAWTIMIGLVVFAVAGSVVLIAVMAASG